MTNHQATDIRRSRLARLGRVAVSSALLGSVALTLAMVDHSVTPFGTVPRTTTPALLVDARPVPQESELTVRKKFVGVVEPRRESRLGFELGGRIAEILVDEGDLVQEGQVLARLDTALLGARRRVLAAKLEEARSRLALAQLTRQRTRKARAQNAVSAKDLDEAEATHDASAAAVAGAESAVAEVDVRLRKATMHAPFAGIVAIRNLDEGEIAAAGAPVVHLLEGTAPEARVGVAGASVSALEAGDTTEVLIEGRRVAARVVSALPIRDTDTRTVEIRLALDTTLHSLRSGDLVELTVPRVREISGTWLPRSALTESSRGLWATYVAIELPGETGTDGATHRLERRDVSIVHAGPERVFVRGGLSDEDAVVRDGLQRLVPGQRVRLTSDGSARGRLVQPAAAQERSR